MRDVCVRWGNVSCRHLGSKYGTYKPKRPTCGIKINEKCDRKTRVSGPIPVFEIDGGAIIKLECGVA